MGLRLETGRLVIRCFEAADEQAWLAMVHEPEFGRFLPPSPPPTAEDFRRMLERRHESERESGYAVWAVDLKSSGSFIGQCGLYPAEGVGPEVEIVYHYTQAAWGKGYATEAARAVLAHGFGPVGLARVIAFVVPENIASCRVAEKAGMRFEELVTAWQLEGLRRYGADRLASTVR